MKRTHIMFKTAAVAIAGFVVFPYAMPTAGQDAPAEGLTALVKALPEVSKGRYEGPGRADAEKLWDKMWEGGAGHVAALVEMMDDAGPGKDFQPRYALHGLVTHLGQPGRDTDRRALVDALAATLKEPKSATTKAIVLRELLHARGREAIPTIGMLLLQDGLCEYASQALFSFGGEAATAELRRAAAKATGTTRMTILRGLGEVRDAKSVKLLTQALGDADRDTRVVAADALAEIGDPASAGPLLKAAGVLSTFERGLMRGACLRLAQRLVEENRKGDAESLLLKLWITATDLADVPLQCAVISGLGKAGTDKAVAMIAESCGAEDARLSLTAVRAAAGMAGREMTWFEALADADEKVRASFVRECALLGSAAAPKIILAGMKDPSKTVRAAAINAVRGDAGKGTVVALIGFLSDSDGGIRDAASKAVRRIQPGDIVDVCLGASLSGGDAAIRCRLMELLAARVATTQRGPVVAALENEDVAVRIAAARALGSLGTDDDAKRLIAILRTTKDGGERAAASDAVARLARRSPAGEKLVAQLRGLLEDRTAAVPRADIVRTLGRIGGPSCLGSVQKALGDPDAGVKDAAVRALSEWPSVEVLPQLLELAKSTDSTTHHVLALRGAVRLLDQPGPKRSPEQSLALYRDVWAMARRADEKKMAMGAVAKIYHVEALDLVQAALNDEKLRNEAESACLSLADRLGKDAQAKDKALAVLKTIAETSKNEKNAKRAKELLGKYQPKK